MVCGSANQYTGGLVGSVDNQINQSIGGVLAQSSYQYRGQQGGMRRRKRRTIKRSKKRSKKSRKSIRRRR
jgi:hypothetical protein